MTSSHCSQLSRFRFLIESRFLIWGWMNLYFRIFPSD
jgi:hypothetical protein